MTSRSFFCWHIFEYLIAESANTLSPLYTIFIKIRFSLVMIYLWENKNGFQNATFPNAWGQQAEAWSLLKTSGCYKMKVVSVKENNIRLLDERILLRLWQNILVPALSSIQGFSPGQTPLVTIWSNNKGKCLHCPCKTCSQTRRWGRIKKLIWHQWHQEANAKTPKFLFPYL